MRVQYRIHPVRTSDLDRILALERASFGPEAYDRKLFAYYRERWPKLFLVAESRGKVCGYIMTSLRGAASGPRAELVSVAVDPARRQAGVASALLDSTLRRLRRRRVRRIHLVVRVTNRPARTFYEKYGFRRIRLIRGYYEDGGDGIAMGKTIA
ncbi:MAG: GNAT family N-acetyltransferase [Acidobacteriia bacterium]|nr:GNAT family N-acetyltransferase [Terriglobia bacterium]